MGTSYGQFILVMAGLSSGVTFGYNFVAWVYITLYSVCDRLIDGSFDDVTWLTTSCICTLLLL